MIIDCWRPDQTQATRDRVWEEAGLTERDAPDGAYDHYLAQCRVAAIELDPFPAGVACYALQQTTETIKSVASGNLVSVTFRVSDIVHALDCLAWDAVEIRDFCRAILEAMDSHGWDEVDIRFH